MFTPPISIAGPVARIWVTSVTYLGDLHFYFFYSGQHLYPPSVGVAYNRAYLVGYPRCHPS